MFLLVKTTLSLPAIQLEAKNSDWIPFLAALVWLIHPIQTQSVTYVIQRMNSMSSMFYMLSLLAYVRGRLSAKSWRKATLFVIAFVAGAMALLSKEIALTLPVFILIYDWYFLKDYKLDQFKKPVVLVFIIVPLVLVLCFLYYGNITFHGIIKGYAVRDFTLVERLLTESRVLIFYLSLIMLPLPSRLNLDHDFLISTSAISPPNTIFSIIFLIFLLISAVLLFNNHKILSFGIIWFLGNLAIESTFVPLEIVFEHRLYLPSTMLIFSLIYTTNNYLPYRHLKYALITVIALFLLLSTYQRNQVWANPVSLWNDCVIKSPGKARVHNNFAVKLTEAGILPEKAEYHLLQAIRLKPNYSDAYNNLANLRWSQRRFDEAIQLYSKAIELTPKNPIFHVNLGHSLVEKQRLQEAREQYRIAMDLAPQNVEAKNSYYMVTRMIAETWKKSTLDN